MSDQPSSKPVWWQTGVIYQIYPRSFMDTSGNGIGDIPGVLEKIDYLSDTLGVDAIWLSPFYPSPMADFGYDISDYTAIHPMFGGMQDFNALLTAAHQRDIRVIIDLVPNHTSDQHAWFKESRASRDNPKRNWYVWRDPKPDGSPPNNWLSVFGGSAWEWDEKTGQYYLHSFLKEQPDLNWRNPQVKEAVFDAARFWLDKGVDGFRIDVAHHIMKDTELRDNPVSETRDAQIHKPLGEYDSQLHVYDKGHPDVHQVYREFRQILDAYSASRPRTSIGEIHIFEWESWVRYYGENLDELHMPFNFSLLGVQWRAQEVRTVVDELEAALPRGAWPNYVLGNHDEPRLASRIGLDSARTAAMLLLTLRGTPTLYYGDEIGMQDAPIPPEKEQDPWGVRVPGLGRDPERTPMQWDASPNAGFCPPDVEPWLPVGPDYKERNVARQLQDDRSMIALYRHLLAYRRAHPSLQTGSYLPVEDVPDPCFVFLREMEGQMPLLVALNFSSLPATLQLSDLGAGHLAISTYLDGGGSVDLKSLALRANEGVIIELSKETDQRNQKGE